MDYVEATNSLLETGCTPVVAPEDGEGKPMSNRRKGCKILLAVVSSLIATVDIITDWYNFFDYKSNIADLEEPEDGAGWVEHMYMDMEVALLVICILGTLTFIMEFTALVFNIRYACRGKEETERYTMLEEISSFLILFLEDVPMIGLFTVATFVGVCPVVSQLRSLPGKIALISSCISTAWRVVQSFNFCCKCNSKKAMGTVICCSCFRCCRSLLLLLSLIFILMLAMYAFATELKDNAVFNLYTKAFGAAPLAHEDRPVYIYQIIDVSYDIERYVDSNGFIHPPPQSEEELLSSKPGRLYRLECDHYLRRINLTNSFALIKADNLGIIRRFYCHQVSDFVPFMLETDMLKYALDADYDCFVVFRVVFLEDKGALYYNGGYELVKKDGGQCLSGGLPFYTQADESEYFVGPPAAAWTPYSVFGFERSQCSNNYRCDPDFALKPNTGYLSFLCGDGATCDLQDDVSRKRDWIDCSPFVFRPWLFDQKVGEAEGFPCYTATKQVDTLDLHLCEKLTDPRSLELDEVVSQFVACPESWRDDNWHRKPA